MNGFLKTWEDASDTLSWYFIKRYFGKIEEVEYYWIAEDVGGVLAVNDYFFSIDDIVNFIKYHYSKDLMFEYYDYALDYHLQTKHKSTDYPINIKNYKELESCQRERLLKGNLTTKSSNSKNKRKLT